MPAAATYYLWGLLVVRRKKESFIRRSSLYIGLLGAHQVSDNYVTTSLHHYHSGYWSLLESRADTTPPHQIWTQPPGHLRAPASSFRYKLTVSLVNIWLLDAQGLLWLHIRIKTCIQNIDWFCCRILYSRSPSRLGRYWPDGLCSEFSKIFTIY